MQVRRKVLGLLVLLVLVEGLVLPIVLATRAMARGGGGRRLTMGGNRRKQRGGLIRYLLVEPIVANVWRTVGDNVAVAVAVASATASAATSSWLEMMTMRLVWRRVDLLTLTISLDRECPILALALTLLDVHLLVVLHLLQLPLQSAEDLLLLQQFLDVGVVVGGGGIGDSCAGTTTDSTSR